MISLINKFLYLTCDQDTKLKNQGFPILVLLVPKLPASRLAIEIWNAFWQARGLGTSRLVDCQSWIAFPSCLPANLRLKFGMHYGRQRGLGTRGINDCQRVLRSQAACLHTCHRNLECILAGKGLGNE